MSFPSGSDSNEKNFKDDVRPGPFGSIHTLREVAYEVPGPIGTITFFKKGEMRAESGPIGKHMQYVSGDSPKLGK